ncbi:hypothetical protein [Microbacterium sp. PAMC21962]|uniref:hypothetical protein n=1 Tax=Microbacterium sp. PAMC21962 TaxID=2861280 RepID=UPI001C629588|nr:hypothetical protein [Microbacterium sp. PAMC21962]QYF98900.1 hypothetical protein KY498_06715 [Microbacterium sp. PAMC21962]
MKKLLYALLYTVAVLTGWSTLWRPPQSIEGPLGSSLTTIWAIALTVGAALALLAVFPGWWWLERTGLFGLGAGALTYFAVVLVLHFQGPPDSSRLTQAGFILMVVFSVCIIRVHEIWRYTFEPRRR